MIAAFFGELAAVLNASAGKNLDAPIANSRHTREGGR
jgi:hypothetical protein